jgi:precorrin-2/cobalt-factor-2 C20-methyltransferase
MGPGDPDLVTVRAVRVLEAAGVVLVPVSADGAGGRAEATVLAHLGDAGRHRLRRVTFAMSDRAGVTPRRVSAWEAAADAVVEAFEAGAQTVAFATIGDPNVYSTFSYLAQTVRARRPDTAVRTVPGITAMQDLASRAGVPLCEGAESLALVPLTAGIDAYRAALRTVDTVVAYKGGRHLPQVLAALDDAGRLDSAVVGSGLGLPEEQITSAVGLDVDSVAPYLTTVIAVPDGRTRGGRL